jgi:hypothetical protein
MPDDLTYDEAEAMVEAAESERLRYLDWYERVGFDMERSDAENNMTDTEESHD